VCVKVYDLQTGQQADELLVAGDTVNGCDAHPCLNLLAVATGAIKVSHTVYLYLRQPHAPDLPVCFVHPCPSPALDAAAHYPVVPAVRTWNTMVHVQGASV
jgi:hypothetical protein